jgi:hypothetical protein
LWCSASHLDRPVVPPVAEGKATSITEINALIGSCGCRPPVR